MPRTIVDPPTFPAFPPGAVAGIDNYRADVLAAAIVRIVDRQVRRAMGPGTACADPSGGATRFTLAEMRRLRERAARRAAEGRESAARYGIPASGRNPYAAGGSLTDLAAGILDPGGLGTETGARGYFPASPWAAVLRMRDTYGGTNVDPRHGEAFVKRERASRRHGARPGDGATLRASAGPRRTANGGDPGDQYIGGYPARYLLTERDPISGCSRRQHVNPWEPTDGRCGWCGGWTDSESADDEARAILRARGVPPMSGGSPYASRSTGWHAADCPCRACSAVLA